MKLQNFVKAGLSVLFALTMTSCQTTGGTTDPGTAVMCDKCKTGWVKRPVLLSLLVRVAAVNADLLTENCAFLHGFGVICLKLARYLLAAGALLAY